MKESKPKNVKINNRKVILNKFVSSNTLTISEIQNDIGLSKTTLAKITSHLLDIGVISESGKATSTDEGGRRAVEYTFNAQYAYCIAIHVFVDKIYAIITDLNIKILAEQSVPIKPDLRFDDFIENIVCIVRNFCTDLQIALTKVAGIAIGSHGLTNAETGVIRYSPHFKALANQESVILAIRQRLPDVPKIFIDNQIRYQLLSELQFGKAKGKGHFLVMEAGYGLCAGLFSSNRVERGQNCMAGEIGHMVLEADSDELCTCGARGCFEALVSESRLVRMAAEHQDRYPQSLVFQKSEPRLSDIIEAFKKGDPLAATLVEDAARWFSVGLTGIFLLIDPDTVIIQGAYAQAGEAFVALLKEKIHRISPMLDNVNPNIELSDMDSLCGAIGGALFIKNDFINSLNFG